MKEHTLTLLGGPRDGVRVSADRLVEAVGALIEGARRAYRFVVEGESLRSGPYPARWKDGTHIDVTGLEAGSTVVNLEAATEPVPAASQFLKPEADWFTPPAASPRAGSSAVDLFAHVLDRAVRGDLGELDADRALLDACARFARAGGDSGIRLAGLSDRLDTVTVRASDAEVIERLRDQTPAPRSVRVTGVLETISAKSPDITLHISHEKTVRARLDTPNPTLLHSLFNTRVVISGRAHFGSSGRLLFVAAEYIGSASPGDELWETVPGPAPGTTSPVFESVPQDAGSGVSAFFGIWPGDESDGELLEALEAIE